MDSSDESTATTPDTAIESWIKPEVKSFAPVKAAEGISYQPGDGVFNLTP